MARQNDNVLDVHAQKYIQSVMAEELRKRGFVSKDGMDLHWYRMVNDTVLQTVFFYTQWKAMPIFMGIAYASCPLFIAPEYPKGLYLSSMLRSREALNPGRMIAKQDSNAVFLSDAAVMCPSDSFHGLDILVEILDKLEKIKSIEDCYAFHKQEYLTVAELVALPKENAFDRISADFMDEVVYMDDQELYPHCEKRITSELQRYERAQNVRKLSKVETADRKSLSRLYPAIVENKSEEHLKHLQERANQNLRQFQRKMK